MSGAAACTPCYGVPLEILRIGEIAKETMKIQLFSVCGSDFLILPSGKIKNESGDTVKEIDETGKIIDLI